MKRYAIIVAGGKGTRMGNDIPKQFIEIAGKPILAHTIENFYRFDPNIDLIIVLPQNQQEYWKRLCAVHRITIPHLVVKGGETRFHSVLNGLSLIPDEGIVAIHDGVRPLTAHRVIENCFHVAEEKGGAIPVLPLTDSLRQIFPDKSSKAVDRTAFVAVQTPQTFRVEEIKKAYKLPYNDTFTDDASVYEAAGYIPELVEGNRENLKITLPVDLAIAEIGFEGMTDLAGLNIKYLPGVGPKRAELLNKELEIFTYLDLLHYYPYKYIDRSKTYKINEIDGSMPYIQLRGKIVSYTTHGEGARRRLTALFSDGSGVIELVWFKGIRYITDRYKPGTEYTLFGKPTLFNGKFNIAHPELDPIDDRIDNTTGLQGYYTTTEKMKNAFLNSKAIQKMVYTLLSGIQNPLPETLPLPIISRMQLMSSTDALRNIHFPVTIGHLRRAEFRLKFEELFYLQLHILRYTRLRNLKLGGFRFDHIGNYFNDFYHQVLPFELTQAQKRVIKEIRADMGSGRQMNRLLQGDVGSGKTLVALMSMLIAVDNGYQACLMAPTEILATQHYEGLKKMVEPLGLRIELLTGSVSKKRRAPILEGLLTGEINLLIGTHALLEDSVNFANLGFVVIDEQHRFGVEQRARLWRKNKIPPHILVMTATPIPRTLAMTVYGDLDVSVIDQLPPGRKPIQTLLQYDNKRAQLYASLRKQLQIGRQAYIVYPLIQESEKSDLKNLEEGYEHIREIFPEYQVCMVHGKMKAAEKETEMQKFVSGEARIMVATTVIEVGVNVPNALVMIIENAERFGLAQLHQLRGRVGRGAEQSYCILMTSYKINQDTRKRLEIMAETNDGFRIAEADMQMRGPGDMEGTQQSGIAFNLQIANLAKDAQILQVARDEAGKLLDSDELLERPENQIVRKELNRIFEKQKNWGLIS